MNSYFFVPVSALPAEGGYEADDGNSAALDAFLALETPDEASDLYCLLKNTQPDSAELEAFPSILKGPDRSEIDELAHRLIEWMNLGELQAIRFDRKLSDGNQAFHGFAFVTDELLTHLQTELSALEAQGWSIEQLGDQVEGHAAKDWLMAGLIAASLSAAPAAQANSGTTNSPAPIEAPAETVMFSINEDVLAEAGAPDATVEFLVDLSAQRGYLMINGKVAVETRVCTGRPGKETPPGTYPIMGKVRSGKRSTIYGCLLPYWMRLTNGGIGLHVGEIRDTPSSAGCIRLPADIAEVLFDHLPRKTEVTVMSSIDWNDFGSDSALTSNP